MTPTAPRRRLLPVLAIGAASLALVGCGTTTSAQTQDWYNPTDGSNSDVEQTLSGMAVRDLLLVSDGTDAAVLATFVNTGADADEVVEVVVEGTSARIDGTLAAEPGAAVRLGEPADTTAVARGTDLEPGGIAEVEVRFASAPAVTLDAVVQAPVGDFEDAAP